MKLILFSVTNYRSVTKAHKIEIKDKTVLVGKNNEGKSNILKALNLSMEILIKHSRPSPFIKIPYNWQVDFPIQLQSRKSGLQSIFRLQFELNESELVEFTDKIGSKLNGIIEIEIKIDRESKFEITVPKKGKNATALTTKSSKIANFISQRIGFNYIPTIRTENHVIRIIQESLDQELATLEHDEDYIKSMKKIADLQQELLDSIAERIKDPLTEFLPSIKNIRIYILEENRRMALRKNVDVIVDDGAPTSIQYKGDGVKSLAALAMLKNKKNIKAASIIAIEEPESHLHPSAIHQLNEVINALSESNQVILTTHNPLFIARDNIKSNIVVDKGKAIPAKGIKEIRDVLGIKASDNLINASYVLVVEGEDDRISLNALLPGMSEHIGKALKNNILKIEEVGGAGNLAYKLSSLRNTLCTYHVLLDHDNAGIKAYESAEKSGLLAMKNTTFTICNGMTESEFEDCLNPDYYKSILNDEYGINLSVSEFKNKNKWSDRLKQVYLSQGKIWNENVEKRVKFSIANCINPDHDKALCKYKRTSIDALVKALEVMVKVN